MRRRGIGSRLPFGALFLLATGVVAIAADPGSAHTRSISYSTWELDGSGASVRTRISRLDFTRLGLDPFGSVVDQDAAAMYLARHLSLYDGDARCTAPHPPVPLRAPTGYVAFSWRLDCPSATDIDTTKRTIASRILTDVAPSHLHFLRVELSDGTIFDRVLSDSDPQFAFGLPGDPDLAAAAQADELGTSIAGYLAIGVEHILSGWDHLAFVVALLLLATTLRELAALVTSFTVAHSVTLGLATLGVVEPDAVAVEALIGFSIALVAAENTWLLSERGRAIPFSVVCGLLGMTLLGDGAITRPALIGLALFSGCHFGLLRRSTNAGALRAAVAFAFGLIHGFGFAGVLSEMSLPTDLMVPALFGFNVGVELGQLGVVAIAWPLLRALDRPAKGRYGRLTAELGSASICAVGLFWFTTRSFS